MSFPSQSPLLELGLTSIIMTDWNAKHTRHIQVDYTEVVHTLAARCLVAIRKRLGRRHDAQDAPHPSAKVSVSCRQEGSLEGHKARQDNPKN